MGTAFVYPGQGSQYVGMGKGLYEIYPEVKELYRFANEILGFELTKASFQGPDEELKQTYITQPAIFVHSLAVTQIIGKNVKANAAAGHSLGEYSAFVYAGALRFEDGLRLVKLRGELMQKVGEEQKGTMAAIVGLDRETLGALCEEASKFGIVRVANFNSPGQIVVSGAVEGVKKLMELAKKRKAKLVKELIVHGAFHSPLMQSAKEDFKKALWETEFNKVKIPVYTNLSSTPVTHLETADHIRLSLCEQLTSPVRWEESIVNMVNDGTDEFIELGPGKVLQGLIKRINANVKVRGFDKASDLNHA